MNQSTALAILKSGHNVFLTGSAGAGKTYVLNQYIKYLKDRKVPVAITASTGIAATHMNGMTIHSWSGIGVRDTLSSSDLKNMKTKKYLKKNLEGVKVLIIDEISMLHRKQVEMVDTVLKLFRESEESFGGIQVVFAGDFFQLPPVGMPGETNRDKFTFMSPAWVNANLAICYLTEQHRQNNDPLNDILNEIRRGERLSKASINLIEQTRLNQLTESYTELYTHNIDVDRINNEKLALLNSDSNSYLAETKGNEKLLEMLKRSVITTENLVLKKGARVMFVKNNYDKGYMNGTLGEVIGFTEDEWPQVKLNNGKVITAELELWSMEDEKGKTLASFKQVPLRLAWAITVHKSQGMTLDAAEIDLSKTFEQGQGYVALSRLKSLQGLHLTDFNQTALEVDSLAQKADSRFQQLSQEFEANIDLAKLEKAAISFVKQCGGITDPDELEKYKNKRKEKKMPKKPTHEITKDYVDKQLSMDEIAHNRGVTTGTIMGHLAKLRDIYPDLNLDAYKPTNELLIKMEAATQAMKKANKPGSFYEDGRPSQKALYEFFKGEISYQEIKHALIFIPHENVTV